MNDEAPIFPPPQAEPGWDMRPPAEPCRLAVIALGLGIASSVASVAAGIPAILYGRKALRTIRESPTRMVGKRFAFWGIALGSLSVAVFLLLAAIWITSLFSADFAAAINTQKHAEVRRVFGNLRRAIVLSHREYQIYPLLGNERTIYRTDRVLMDPLLGENERGIVFFSGRTARLDDEGRPFRGVHVDGEGHHQLLDPWGNLYRVKLDLDYDGFVQAPHGPADIAEPVLIWSSGADGEEGTGDDLKSW